MRDRGHRPTVLLTGFGPFPGVPVNVSWALVERLAPAAKKSFPGHSFVAEQLSTEWHGGTRRLIDLIEAIEPAVTLHFGVSRKATGFVIETRGHNEQSTTADACGMMPASAACLVDGGPARLDAQLPANLIAHRLRLKGLPVEISRDAGRYLCNAALYHSLEIARRRERSVRAAGFVHLPVEIGTLRRGRSQLTMATAIEGGLEIIGACIGRSPRPSGVAMIAGYEARRPSSALLRY